MKTSTIVIIVLAAVLLFGGWYWYAWQGSTTSRLPVDTVQPQAQNTGISVGANGSVSGAPMSATVVYGPSGFSPASVTIALGGTITFINQSGGGMWVGANQHPTHTEYDGTTRSEHCAAGYAGEKPFDQCVVGGSFSFTFTKTGSFNYHNHVNAGAGGVVVVQ